MGRLQKNSVNHITGTVLDGRCFRDAAIATDVCIEYSEMPAEKTVVDQEKCVDCGMCLKACFSEAMQQGDEKVFVKEENCVGCGGCYSVCPVKGAVEMNQV